jgi:hypothetical protein
MDQDDPCILSLLRGQYLHPPSKNKLSLEAPEVTNPSMGQAQSILEILKNKVTKLGRSSFFLKCMSKC